MRTSAGVTYLHSDHLGSTSVTSGAQPSSQTYYPYGAVRSGTLPTDYTFTGQKRDNEAGLHFYNARYYDGAIGRFTQPDSIIPDQYNPQSLNRYAYGLNNPVKYVDPTGHAPVELDENGNEFIDYSWRARQRAFDETGVIIIGRATNFEINIVREIASIFPPLSSGDVKSPVVIISSVRSKDLGMVEITPGPRFGIATIYKKEILACALARDCGDYTGVPYETQFKRWTAHELAHKAALNDPRLKAAYDKIFNSDPQGEPTSWGSFNSDEALAEFVAIAVVNPAGTKDYPVRLIPYSELRWPWRDAGKARRDFIHSWFPKIPNVPY